MTRNYLDYLEDIMNALDETAEFTSQLSFDEFKKDRKTINAVLRSLEVLGEAAKKIPDDIRQLGPDIPWCRMAGMRDKLIHEYFGVDMGIVWAVVQEELPRLKVPVKCLIQHLEETHH